MNTQQQETGQGKGASPQASPSFHTQQTSAIEKLGPAQTFPQPPRSKNQYWIVGVLVAILLVIALSVGTLLLIPPAQHPAGKES